jgi:DNA-binding transcriptional regulator YiaG
VTPAELRAALARLGMSQSAAARELGVSDRTVRRWCADPQRAPVPAATAKLLTMMQPKERAE